VTVVVLLGPPGVGKGTQAVRMADELGAAHVSTGDLLRAARRDGTELGKKAQAYMDAGEYVPDELILDLVRDHLDSLGDVPVFFDGFPRTTAQAEGLDEVLASLGKGVDVVAVFSAPEETLVKRLSGRRSCPQCGAIYNVFFNPPSVESVCDRCGGVLVHRTDDDPDTVRRRLEVYEEQTAPLVSFYEGHPAGVARIAADRSVADVYEDFSRAVRDGR
jgi:adenylate kinase